MLMLARGSVFQCRRQKWNPLFRFVEAVPSYSNMRLVSGVMYVQITNLGGRNGRSNGECLIRVDLHDVIEDPLGNEAATHRRIRLNHTLPFPTYHLDGHAEVTPSMSRGELQMSLLAAESSRKTHEVIEATIDLDDTGGIVTVEVNDPIQIEGTQLTLLLLETSVTLTSSEATNGLLIHPAVFISNQYRNDRE